MRVCSKPGCPTLVPTSGLCPTHARDRDKARGSRQARGYGSTHDALRARWKPRVDRGIVECSRCHQLIGPHEAWHLDHDDADRSKYRGPSHDVCNLSAAGRASHGLPAKPPF